MRIVSLFAGVAAGVAQAHESGTLSSDRTSFCGYFLSSPFQSAEIALATAS
jgi:hypothetical protein